MVTGEQQIGLVAMRVSSRLAVVLAVVVASEEQVVRVAPVVRVVRVAPVAPVVPAVQVAPVAPVVRVVRVAPAVPENPAVPAVPENPVAAELALVPVAAELVLAQAVVRLRTKLVIAAHPHGLLRPLAEAEVSAAAVAEISLAPAATEAATAWGAAGTAVVAAAE